MIDLNVVRLGEGEPPLLLVHGYTGSSLDFAEVMPVLAEKRRVIAYDHRGHGGSPHVDGDLAYTVNALVSDLEDLVDAEGLDHFDLLGHSMGGVVAQRYVLAHPDRVRSLVLMDTMPAPSIALPMDWVNKMVEKARVDGMESLADAMVEGARRIAITPPREEILANMRTKLVQMDPEAYAGFAAELSEFPSMLERLGEISCPTTVLVGANDQPFIEPSRAMAAAIAGSELVIIDDAGHCPQEDRPGVWIAEIERHLARPQ